MDEKVLIEFALLKKRINELSIKMDQMFTDKNLTNEANIEYVAMMTDVELPENEEVKE